LGRPINPGEIIIVVNHHHHDVVYSQEPLPLPLLSSRPSCFDCPQTTLSMVVQLSK
jgi:hypothetical protein